MRAVWGRIALRLVDDNPAEAERVWKLTKEKGRRIFMDPTLAWKLATVDPAAARRVIEGLSYRKIDPLLFPVRRTGRERAERDGRARCVSDRCQRDRSVIARKSRRAIRSAPAGTCRSSSTSTRLSYPRSSGSTCLRGSPPAILACFVPGRRVN